MIKIYRTISTVKAKEVSGNKPTHYLRAGTSKDDKEGELVASLWSKEYNGSKFLSGEMKKKWIDQDGNFPPREGYVIVKETDLSNLIQVLREYKIKLGEADTAIEEEMESANIDDIPF